MDIASNVLHDHCISIWVAIFNKHSSSQEYDSPMNSFYSTLGRTQEIFYFYSMIQRSQGHPLNYLSRPNFNNNFSCTFPWPFLWQEEKHCNLSNKTLKISSLILLFSKWLWRRKITYSKENSHVMSKLRLGYKFIMPRTI